MHIFRAEFNAARGLAPLPTPIPRHGRSKRPPVFVKREPSSWTVGYYHNSSQVGGGGPRDCCKILRGEVS